jgi:uncharacterized SAM-binding protein YcdF (DUF218 family)
MTAGQRGGIIFRLLALMALCLFAGIIYLARHPLLQLAARFWIVQDRVTPADAIIVIGDDNFSAVRAEEAAALFKAGWAPLVVASGRMLRPYASLADLMAKDLESGGVPSSAVVLFSHRATDTREEAEALRVLVVQKGWRRILLVTSNYHTRRARYIFRKILPSNISLAVAGAADPQFNPSNWWESRQARKAFFLETMGYLEAIWELRNQPAGASPASLAPFNPFRAHIDRLVTLCGESPALFSLHR